MTALCGMPTIQFQLEAPGCLCASCLLPAFDAASATWLNSRSSLAVCDWLLSALSALPSTHVQRRRKFWEVSCTECTGQGNDFELIPTVKMETRHPAEGSFGKEFTSIYKYCVVMATWSLKTLKNQFFCVFLENDTLPENFQNSVPKGFIATLIDVLCSNFVKFDRRETGKIVRCLPEKKKTSPGSPALATARIEPKICRGHSPTMSSECSRFHPNRLTFGGVISERVNTIRARSKVNPIFDWSLSSSRIITQQN